MRNVLIIYHASRYQMQTDMSRGPLAEGGPGKRTKIGATEYQFDDSADADANRY